MKLKPYPEYNNSSEMWLGKIPLHWDKQPLRALLENRNEKNYPIKTTQILSLSIAKGVTLYSDKGRGGNKFKNDLTAYKIAYPNDIILNSMNVIVGAVGLSKYLGAISPVYYSLYSKTNKVDIHYYDKIFSNYKFQNYLSIFGKGILIKKSGSGKFNTIRMKISLNDLRRITLPFPPKEEQEQIVKFLNYKNAQIAKFIRNKKRMIQLLKEQKQAIINQAVTKGINPNVKIKPSGIDWIGDIPEHWECLRLKRIAIFSPSKSELDKDISMTDITTFLPMEAVSTNGSIDCTRKYKIRDLWDGFTYFKRNDIIVAKITPCFENGKGAYLNDLDTDFGFGSTEFIVIRSLKNVDGEFLYYLTKTSKFRKHGEEHMVGAAGQKRISLDFVKNYIVVLPCIEEQIKIVTYIKKKIRLIDKIIIKTQKEINLIQEYRTRLISDIVTGKIDVRGIEVEDIPDEELIDEIATTEEPEVLEESSQEVSNAS